MALVSLSTLRLHLGLAPDTSTDGDSLLTALETQAVGFLEAVSGWNIDSVASVTDYYHGTGTNSLTLRGVPDTGETFTVSTRAGDTWTAVDSTDYSVLIEGGGARARVLSLVGGWPQGELNIKVVSTRGYTSATCPALLQRAILDVVQLWYRTRKTARPTASADSEASPEPDALGLASVKAWLQASAIKQEAVLLPPLARM